MLRTKLQYRHVREQDLLSGAMCRTGYLMTESSESAAIIAAPCDPNAQISNHLVFVHKNNAIRYLAAEMLEWNQRIVHTEL